MLDMLMQGGCVVTPAGVGEWDVGMAGKKMVAWALPGLLPAGAPQVISLQYEENQRFLWDGLLRGDLSFTATDSSFTTYLDKLAGRNVMDVRGGNIGIRGHVMGVNGQRWGSPTEGQLIPRKLAP